MDETRIKELEKENLELLRRVIILQHDVIVMKNSQLQVPTRVTLPMMDFPGPCVS